MADDLSVKVRVAVESKDAQQALGQVEGGVKALGNAAQPTAGNVGDVGKALTETAASADGLGGSLKAAAGPLMAITAGLAGGRAFIDANLGMESMTRTLTQMTGSSEAARAEIDWLRETSNRLGIEFDGASRAWVGLAAAAKGAAMEGAKSRAVFEAVAGSMAMLGKSSADTEGALLAISQMISKGVVSMEEMRQQLGERLPGAMQATADSMGVTTEDLNKMIESGTVLAEDLLPHLAEGLKKTYGLENQQGIEGTVSAWNRLKNSLSETMVYVGESGKAMDALVFAVEGVTKIVRGASASFELLGKTVGTTAAFLVDAASGPIGAWGRYKETMKVTLDEVAQKFSAVDRPFSAFAEKQEKLTAGAKTSSEETKKSTGSWQALTLEMSKTGKANEEAVKLAEKTVEARKAENKAALDLANALGSEEDKRQAGMVAARSDAQAISRLAEARMQDAAAARNMVEALTRAANAEGKVSEQRRQAIDEAEKSAQNKEKEAEKSVAQALAAQQHADVLEVESARLADNAAQVDVLRTAHEQALVALQATEAEHRAGMATQAEVNSARLAAAKASALYRDALSDVTAALAQKAAQERSENGLSQAGVRLAIEKARTSLEVARAKGDEAGMIRAKNELSRLEIQLANLKADALRLEAKAILESVAAKREELKAAGALTAAKESELKAQEASAKVKQLEADIASETAKRLRELESASRGVAGGTLEMDKALGVSNRQLVEVADSADKAADAYRRLNEEQRKGGGGSGGSQVSVKEMRNLGLSQSEINNILSDRETSDFEKANNIVKRPVRTVNVEYKDIANEKGFFGEDAERFVKNFSEAMDREMTKLGQRYTGMAQDYGIAYRGHFDRAIEAAKDQTNEEIEKAKRAEDKKASDEAVRRFDEDRKASRQPSSMHQIIDIRLPSGERGKVATASSEDADELSRLLRRLGDDAKRSVV